MILQKFEVGVVNVESRVKGPSQSKLYCCSSQFEGMSKVSINCGLNLNGLIYQTTPCSVEVCGEQQRRGFHMHIPGALRDAELADTLVLLLQP